MALVVVLVAAAVLMRGRGRLPETPEDAVSAMFDAAGRGDAATYLNLLTGDLKGSVENSRSQLGAEGFSESLRRSVAGIKSFAVNRAPEATPGGTALDVELVFVDRNEMQRFFLVPQGGGWAIAAIDKAQMRKPPVAYGTPVFEETAPESGKPKAESGKP